MNRFSTLLLACALICTPAVHLHAQDEDRPRLNPSTVPEVADHAADFVTSGWIIEEEIRGDLNRDNAEDIVLSLVEDLPVENSEGTPNNRNRAVVVLFKKATGYRRVVVAPTLLYCTMCSGMLSDPSGSGGLLKIEKGVLVADQLSGSRDMVTRVQRFRWDQSVEKMMLIGEDVVETDRVDGNWSSTSNNYLTGQRITEVYKVDRRTGKEKRVKKTKSKIAQLKRTIEEIDYNGQE